VEGELQVTLREESKMPGIVVGIDGSAHSRHALEWAMSEAALRGTPVTVLTVAQITTAYWGPAAVWYPPLDLDVTEQALKAAHEEVGAVLDRLGPDSPRSVRVQAVVGLPAEEILRAAQDADMIVVGSRGAGGFRKLLMGSVSLQVTHHAHCPVVVIPAADDAAFIS
jgi:nucleotide-binding universal stress UspA family protein